MIVNYVVGVKGLNGNTVGSLSDKYDTLFTPAGYAFSIWGLIFLFLLGHAYYQVKVVFFQKQHDEFVLTLGPWLALANAANIAWLFAWLMEYTGLSLLFMLFLLLSLIVAVVRLNLQRWDAPFTLIKNVWWPITIYFGWITVATIANVSAYLVKIGWNEDVDEVHWTVIMLIVATGINLAILYLRSMREYAAVGLWAILAIGFRHWGEVSSDPMDGCGRGHCSRRSHWRALDHPLAYTPHLQVAKPIQIVLLLFISPSLFSAQPFITL